MTKHTREIIAKLQDCYPWLPKFIYGTHLLDRAELPFPFNLLMPTHRMNPGGMYFFSGLFYVRPSDENPVSDNCVIHESIHSVISRLTKIFDYLGINYHPGVNHVLSEGITEILTLNALEAMDGTLSKQGMLMPTSFPLHRDHIHLKNLEAIARDWQKILSSPYLFEMIVAMILIQALGGFENFVRVFTEPPENITDEQQKILRKLIRIMARHHRQFTDDNIDTHGFNLSPFQTELIVKLCRWVLRN